MKQARTVQSVRLPIDEKLISYGRSGDKLRGSTVPQIASLRSFPNYPDALIGGIASRAGR